ncbi:MAG TPA: tyrosine-type recombinase/integrase [Solirubrobacteraceae bacterium]|nr:tyrosine-type recombinase/integrase [Solirubrobacteraceae bacterium]
MPIPTHIKRGSICPPLGPSHAGNQRQSGESMQVGQARTQYLRWLLAARDLSPHTIRAYGSDIAAFERHLGSSMPVRQIDRDSVLGFLEQLRADGLSAKSIRRRLAGLRGFCRWLCSQDHLDSDPSAEVHASVGRSRVLPRVVPRHELDCLLHSLRFSAGLKEVTDANQVLRRPTETTTLLATALMVATGARVHEVVDLRCTDIDLSGRSLRITGKGRRQRQVYLTNDWITGLTEAYIEARRALAITHPQLLFNSHHDVLTASALRTRLVKAAQNAGLGTRVTPHMLRHSAATQLIEAGVDIRFIQRLLGHASLTTTEIYTHVSDGALSRVVSDADVLGRLLDAR